MPFPPEQVPLFLAVLDTGSFSAAARQLGRVPSAVSMAVGQLEAELGLQLFDRRGREPTPTAAARALEPQARLLAQQLQQLNQQALALHQGLEERLTLAIAPELLTTPWADALRPVTERYPALARHLRDASGKLRTFVNVYLNDEDIRYLPERDATALRDGDNLIIVPSIAGGVT